MAVTQTVKIEMLEKLADGNFKLKYPKTIQDQVVGLETAQKVLEKIKTVDGTGSGLDADTLDGKHANEFSLDKLANGSWTSLSIALTNGVAREIARINLPFTPKFLKVHSNEGFGIYDGTNSRFYRGGSVGFTVGTVRLRGASNPNAYSTANLTVAFSGNQLIFYATAAADGWVTYQDTSVLWEVWGQ